LKDLGSLIILKWTEVGSGLNSSASWQGPVDSSCEHCKEISGSIKGEEHLDQVGCCQLLEVDSNA
jgi:hypothetical protein